MLVVFNDKLLNHAPYTVSKSGERKDTLEIHSRVSTIINSAKNAAIDVSSLDELVLDLECYTTLLQKIHCCDYLKYLEQSSNALDKEKTILSETYAPDYIDADTPVFAGINDLAIQAAKLSYLAADSIKQKKYRYSYAVCRPPGHHAGPNYMGGYCYINNALVAAELLIDSENVAIIDIDYHMGNGTADYVRRHPHLIYYSIHSTNSNDYPYQEANWDCERIINIGYQQPPTPKQYLASFQQILDDALQREITALVISIGFDIIKGDPHGSWTLMPNIFEQIATLLKESKLPVCFIQEGGYNIKNIENCTDHLFNVFKSETS